MLTMMKTGLVILVSVLSLSLAVLPGTVSAGGGDKKVNVDLLELLILNHLLEDFDDFDEFDDPHDLEVEDLEDLFEEDED